MGAQPISAVPGKHRQLVTKDKVLTERTIQAVNRLRERGITFTISAAAPRRHAEAGRAAGLTMPMAAFNGGVILLPDLSVLDERAIPEYVVPASSRHSGPRARCLGLQCDRLVRPVSQSPRVDREDRPFRLEPTTFVSRFDSVPATSSRSSASAMSTTGSPTVKPSCRKRFIPRSPRHGRNRIYWYRDHRPGQQGNRHRPPGSLPEIRRKPLRRSATSRPTS